jgi:hypothetical protein
MDSSAAYIYGKRDATRDFGNVGSDYAIELAGSAYLTDASLRSDCASRTRIVAILDSFEVESGRAWFKEAAAQWIDGADPEDAPLARHYAQGYVSQYFALIRDAAVQGCFAVDADDRAEYEGFSTYA